jgi:hypothetical protein
MTSGFSSIISVWAWYISSTLCLVIPAGSGVHVVKTDVLDILYAVHRQTTQSDTSVSTVQRKLLTVTRLKGGHALRRQP